MSCDDGGKGSKATDGGNSEVPEACPAGSLARVSDTDCQPVGAGVCASGFVEDGTGWGCTPILPSGPCPTGAAPLLAHLECQAVGAPPCASGFGVTAEGACTSPRVDACVGATRAALGSETCVAIGDCDGGFPPVDADLVVDAAVPEDPALGRYQTLTAALAVATPRMVIAIERGNYPGPSVVNVAATLVGRCAAQTRLVGTGDETEPALAFESVDAAASGLTVTGFGNGGIHVASQASVRLSDVVVDGNGAFGIAVEDDGEIDVQRSAVRGHRGGGGAVGGRGVSVAAGGDASLVDVDIDDNQELGVIAAGAGARVTLERTWVQRTLATDTGAAGFGVAALNGGVVDGATVVIARGAAAAIVSTGAQSSITLTDAVIEEHEAGALQTAIRVEHGGALKLVRATVQRNAGAQLVVTQRGSADIEDSSVLDPVPVDGVDVGAVATDAAELRFKGVRFAGAGIAMAVADASLTASSCSVEGTAGSMGLYVIDDAAVELESSYFLDHPLGAIVALGGTTVVRSTAIMGGTHAPDTPAVGIFVEAADVSVHESLIDGVVGAGVSVAETGSVVLTDVLVRNIHSDGAIIGKAVFVRGGAAEILRTRIEDIDGNGIVGENSQILVREGLVRRTHSAGERGIGILASGLLTLTQTAVLENQTAAILCADAQVEAMDVLIADAVPAEGRFGHGIAMSGGSLLARGVEVRGSAFAGLLFVGSAVSLGNSWVHANRVGISVQGGVTLSEVTTAPDVPVAKEVQLGGDVLIVDNETRIGTGEVPLPDPFQ